MPAIFTAVIAIAYACYSSVGLGVFGYLPGYAQEEGINSGSRFFLLTRREPLVSNRNVPTIGLYRTLRRRHGHHLHLGYSVVAANRPDAFILSALVDRDRA